jgi:predicted ABC-class ATPase
MSSSSEDLQRELERIDGRGYPAYKDLRGSYAFSRFTLYIDHVQGDPFAAPSKIRVRVPNSLAGFPEALRNTEVRRMALADAVAREIRSAIPAGVAGGEPQQSGSGGSGAIRIDAGGQEVLERSAVRIEDDWIEARMEVGLPAAGRRILGNQAVRLLCKSMPEAALRGLLWEDQVQERIWAFVESIENQEAIRDQLEVRGLIAFVGNGSTLPRENGASDRPLEGTDVIPFLSPAEFEVEFEVPNSILGERTDTNIIRGMGIPAGVSLIVGGGYHGKSTLLRALERCVYPHVPGDGRENVVSARDLVKIRAEDGRRVEQVDIHAFIGDLPGGRSTRSFCSDDASGSTSQAANIIEAIESGCVGLLLDEDTSATNFMIRDARMQALVHKKFEPITPYLERVGELYQTLGISTVLVMGGCGDYFDVADHVIQMRDYIPQDATEAAREISRKLPGSRRCEKRRDLVRPKTRIPISRSIDAAKGRRKVSVTARGREQLLYGRQKVDLRGLEQLVDTSQTRAVGLAIYLASTRIMNDDTPLAEVLDALEDVFDCDGLDLLDPRNRGEHHPGDLARPRRHEIASALNRMRSLKVQQSDPTRSNQEQS